MDLIRKIEHIQVNNWFPNKNYLCKREDGFFKYWRYHFLRPILKLFYRTFRFIHRPAPWFSPAATIFLKSYLTKDSIGAEFGSGYSTLFIAPRVKKLVSIEHNKLWHDKIEEELRANNFNNVEYKFIPQQEVNLGEDTPKFIKEFSVDIKEYEYRTDYVNYYTALETYKDDFFDFIIVDGRARPECVFSCYKKLKKGGLMVLDNSGRDRYKIVFEKLKHLNSITTTNGLTNTTFWQKI